MWYHLVPLGIWAAPVLTLAETFADPAVQAAEPVEEIDIRWPAAYGSCVSRSSLSSGRATIRRPRRWPASTARRSCASAGTTEDAIRRLRDERVV